MTAALVDGLARYVAQLGRGIYRRGTPYEPDEVAIVLGGVIPDPARLIVITPYVSGPEPDSVLPFSEPAIQWRIRGTGDETVSHELADALYSDLHGLGPIELPGGVLMLSCIATQTATPLGRDEAGRFEHVFNTRCEIHHPTANRPPL